MQAPGALLSPSSKKKKKKKSTVKKFLILSQEKTFLIFREMELFGPKIKRFLIFSYISGNETF